MQRRDFLAAGAAAAMAPHLAARTPNLPSGESFKLDYAPHFGMFRHHAGDDLLDQLRFMHDEGFRSLEDNGLPRRDVKLQEAIGAQLERLSMRMGVFVAHADFGSVTFASNDASARERIVADMRAAVEVAQRVNARWCTVVPGRFVNNVDWDHQTANVIDILEPARLTMVLEPLNALVDHPGLFLTKMPQAYMLCRAVDSPACKILDDLYHQQVTEGNLIGNIDAAWSEIAYFQVGDHPGRKEPTTGEINYRNVFRHIHRKGFSGIVGMEHGNSRGGKDGERAVIDAYRWCDDF